MSYFDKEKNPYGIDKNAHYFMRMHPMSSLWFVDDCSSWVECKIDESQYKVDDGYKVTLVPLDPRYASRSFYQSDVYDMMIKKTSEDMKVRTVIEYIPLTDNVHLVWSGNYVE